MSSLQLASTRLNGMRTCRCVDVYCLKRHTLTLLQFWQINREGTPVAYFYLDPYSRPHEKRQVVSRLLAANSARLNSKNFTLALGRVDGLCCRPQSRLCDCRARHRRRGSTARRSHGLQRFAPC